MTKPVENTPRFLPRQSQPDNEPEKQHQRKRIADACERLADVAESQMPRIADALVSIADTLYSRFPIPPKPATGFNVGSPSFKPRQGGEGD